jgi:uncharacterized protein (TIRG00374 family)
MRALKWLLLAAGFGVLAWTFRSVGWTSVYENLRLMGWAWAWLFPVYGLVYALNTAGWRYSFPRKIRVPFGELFTVRVIGESLNAALPMAASLGGEPVKAVLLEKRHGVPPSETYASSLIVHTTLWASLNFFVIGGVLAAHRSMPLTPFLWRSVAIFLAALGAGGLFLLWGLRAGVFTAVYRVGARFKWWGAGAEKKFAHYEALDGEIRAFYKGSRGRFWLSTLFNSAAWLAASLEILIVARVLGIPLGFAEAWLIQALIQVVRMVTFFVPAGVGTQEGGIVLLFSQFGLPVPAGLALAVILRVRELAWMGVGMLLWAGLKDPARPRQSS